MDVAWQQNNEKGGWGWKQKYNNEQRKTIWHTYDTIFHKMLPSVISEYDADRFYWPSSPLADWGKSAGYDTKSGDMHYWGVWHGKDPFSAFNKYLGRFMSEYGFQSFPEFKSVKSYTIPKDWNIFSDVMLSHQRSPVGNGLIKDYMEKSYKVPTDFKNFLYVGQVLQAEGIKSAMEIHRRNMPYCMGSLFWQINDCWPVASWSSTDYYRRWKALQYFAKKAYAPVLVSPYLDNDKISVFIVSDLLEDTKATIDVKVIDFNGKTIFQKNEPVDIKANSSHIYFKDEIKNMAKDVSNKNCLFSVSINEGEKVLSDNILYFLPVKDLDLPKATIKKNIKLKNGEFEVELTTDKLAKNLFLNVENGDGFFSDNYFDMLPRQTITVHFKPSGDMDEKTFEKNFTILQMGEI
jgi:beta-mannosidase